MARIKFGAVIVDTRGSVGGTTLRGTQYGPVAYNKATPTKKLTSYSSIARSNFSAYSKRWWQNLDATQRDEWRALAAANPITNTWGDEYALTGIAYYIKLNCRLLAAGLPPIDDAPLDQAVDTITSLTITATAPDSLILTYTPTPTPSNHRLWIEATPALSPGVANYDRRIYFLGIADAAETSPFEAAPLYTVRLTPLFTGRQYAVAARLLKTTNAALSPAVIAAAVAT